MINKIFVLFLLTLCLGCDVETNTVNPQNSQTIEESRKYSLLLSVGKIKAPIDTNHLVKEVWIERSWKNSLKKGIKYRELLGSKNVVVTLNESKMNDKGDYSIDWFLSDSKGNTFGSGNNCYDLDYDNFNSVSLYIVILKDSSKIDLGTYVFHPIGN